MSRIWTVCYYTFKESFARKTFIGFFVISSIVLAIFLLAMNVDVVNGALASLSFFGKKASGVNMDVKKFVSGIEMGLATLLFAGGLFLSIFATASLVPNMLEKGNIDWVLSKPISRFELLLGRYLGAIGIVAFNIFYLVGGSWLILSLKTGYWHFPFLVSGFLLTVIFAVLYSFMVLLGVLLQNSAISIMGAYLMIFFSPMLFQREKAYALLSRKIYQYILDGIYYLTAHIFETGDLMKKIIMQQPVKGWGTLWHSFGLTVLYFALAIIFFKRKDF